MLKKKVTLLKQIIALKQERLIHLARVIELMRDCLSVNKKRYGVFCLSCGKKFFKLLGFETHDCDCVSQLAINFGGLEIMKKI